MTALSLDTAWDAVRFFAVFGCLLLGMAGVLGGRR